MEALGDMGPSKKTAPAKKRGDLFKKILGWNVAFYFIQYAAMSYILVLSLSLFLKKVGPASLPLSFILSNSILLFFQLAMMTVRKAPEYKILMAGMASSVIYLLLCNAVFFKFEHYLAYLSFVVIGNVLVSVSIFAYLAYLNQKMPLRMQKNCLPYIHGASSLGGVISGFTLGPLIAALGLSNMINLIIAMNLISVAIMRYLNSLHEAAERSEPSGGDDHGVSGAGSGQTDDDGENEADAISGGQQAGFVKSGIETDAEAEKGVISIISSRFAEIRDYLGRTRLVYYMAAIIFIVNFNENLIDYIFSTKLTERFRTVDEIASFTGNFRAMNLLIIMLIQIFALRPFLKYFSVTFAVAATSILLIPAGAAAIISFTFFSALLVKFCNEISIKSFHRPAVGILTNPMGDMKTRAALFFEFISYSAKIIAGLALFFLKVSAGVKFFVFVVFGLSLAHIYFSSKLSDSYIALLKNNLESSGAGRRIKAISDVLFVPRDRIIDSLLPLLSSKDPDERYAAIKKISSFDGTTAKIFSLLESENDPKNIATIISILSRDEDFDFESDIDKFLKHPDARVRANVIEGFGKLRSLKDKGMDETRLLKFLEDGNTRIRANAVIAILNLSDSAKNIDAALESLAGMLLSKNEPLTASGTAAMGLIGHRVFTGALASCLENDSERVRRNAIISLSNLNSAGARQILSGHLAVESSATLKAIIEESIKMSDNECARLITSALAGLAEDERDEITELLKPLDPVEMSGPILGIVMTKDAQTRLKLARYFNRYNADKQALGFAGMVMSMPHNETSENTGRAPFNFDEFEKAAITASFKPREYFYDLYDSVISESGPFAASYLGSLIDLFIISSRAARNSADSESGREIFAASSELEKNLLNHIINMIALATPDRQGSISAFNVALEGDPKMASYAVELIETSINHEISSKIAEALENYSSAEAWDNYSKAFINSNITRLKKERSPYLAALPKNYEIFL